MLNKRISSIALVLLMTATAFLLLVPDNTSAAWNPTITSGAPPTTATVGSSYSHTITTNTSVTWNPYLVSEWSQWWAGQPWYHVATNITLTNHASAYWYYLNGDSNFLSLIQSQQAGGWAYLDMRSASTGAFGIVGDGTNRAKLNIYDGSWHEITPTIDTFVAEAYPSTNGDGTGENYDLNNYTDMYCNGWAYPEAAMYYILLKYDISGYSSITNANLSFYVSYNFNFGGTVSIGAAKSASSISVSPYTNWDNYCAWFVAPVRSSTGSSKTITGTPTTQDIGTWNISIKMTAGGGYVWENWTITVSTSTPSAWAPAFTSSPDTTGNVGVYYEYVVTWNESISAWSIETDWGGLYSASGNHTIWGTPSVATSYYIHISATSTAGTLTSWQNYTFTVSEADHWAPMITSTPPLWGYDGYPFSYVVTANESVTWSGATSDATWLNWGAANHTWWGTADTGTTYSFANLTPTADATVSRSYPNTNYGSATYQIIASTGGYTNYLFYQRWDLSSLPTNAVISNAGLWMDEYSSSGSGTLRLYNCSAVNWAENTITWNNRPAGSNLVTTYTDSTTGWHNYSGTDFINLVKWQYKTYHAVYLLWTNNPSVYMTKYWYSEEATYKPRLHINYYTGDDEFYAHVKATSVGGGDSAWDNVTFYVVTGIGEWAPTLESITPVGGVLYDYDLTMVGEPYFWAFTFNESCTYNVYTNAPFLTCGSGLAYNNTIVEDLWDTAFGGWDVVEGVYWVHLIATSSLGLLDFEMNFTLTVYGGLWAPHMDNSATLTVRNNTFWSYQWLWNESTTISNITSNATWISYDYLNNTVWGIPTETGTYWFSIMANSSDGTLTGYYNFTLTVYVPAPHEKNTAEWIGERITGFIGIAALLVCILIFPVTIIMVRHGENGVKAGVRAVVVFLISAFLFVAMVMM